LKQFGIFIFVLLMFVPPVQAHADAVIFSDTLARETEVLGTDHQKEHHKNDTEEDKNTEHHHHCTSLGFSSALIYPFVSYANEIGNIQEQKPIHFHQKSFISNYLETLIKPPQI
jgi:hypothetical protein